VKTTHSESVHAADDNETPTAWASNDRDSPREHPRGHTACAERRRHTRTVPAQRRQRHALRASTRLMTMTRSTACASNDDHTPPSPRPTQPTATMWLHSLCTATKASPQSSKNDHLVEVPTASDRLHGFPVVSTQNISHWSFC